MSSSKKPINVYPKHFSLIKGNKKTENFFQKLEESPQKSSILDLYTEIDGQIEVINKNLMDSFKKQEDDLLTYYKTEMFKAQKHLKELSDTMNEDMLKKRMNDRKEDLEKERSKLLCDSLQFSNQCKDLKENLTELLIYSDEIKDELHFLDEQLVYADQQNLRLKNESDNLKELVLKENPDFNLEDKEEDIWNVLLQNKSKHQNPIKEKNTNILTKKEEEVWNPNQSKITNEKNKINDSKRSKSQIKEYDSPYSKKHLIDFAKIPYKLDELKEGKEFLKKQKDLNKKLRDISKDDSFKLGFLEKIFSESVEKIKKRSSTRLQKKISLPNLTNKSQENSVNFSKIRVNESLSTELSILSELELNELDKRLIMDDFLQNEEIKKYIYKILFEKNELHSNDK